MWLYHLAIKLYWISAKVISPFNEKAAGFTRGRKAVIEQLKKRVPSGKKVIWIHCASLGEFEQGRPLIEAWKEQFPEDFILLTFFSPSGYEVRKNFPIADYVAYLPVDTKKNVRRFLQAVNPDKAVFIKYEFWLNYIDALYEREIPLYLVSGIFRRSQHFFRWYGSPFLGRLRKFRHFFVQNEESASLLDAAGIKNYTVTGDTRFDRVAAIASKTKEFDELKAFCENSVVIIAGSTWPAGEKLFAAHIVHQTGKDLKLIIAPHMVNQSHMQQLRNLLPDDTVFWTTASEDKIRNARVLVVDTIGILSSLYQYGDIAYIGGGFGKGIHNTLEAATFNLPVVFGPNHQRFQEAKDLIDRGGAFSVKNSEEFSARINELVASKDFREKAGNAAGNYVRENTGSTSTIISMIK